MLVSMMAAKPKPIPDPDMSAPAARRVSRSRRTYPTSRCNRCVFEWMQETGGHRLATPVERAIIWDADAPDVFTAALGPGVVVVDAGGSRFVAWFARLPDKCEC